MAGKHLASPTLEVGGIFLTNVHDETQCQGRPCVVHNQSDHHMRQMRLHWRDDRGIFERICPHGIGHPDPDEMSYQLSRGRPWQGIHGCDGCCVAPKEEN